MLPRVVSGSAATIRTVSDRAFSVRLMSSVQAPPVLLLGDERLRIQSAQCDFSDPKLVEVEQELHAALAQFRSKNGYGRAVSAPQINRHVRMIACDLGKNAVHRPDSQPFTLCNPLVINRSAGTFSLWDDCMSFPNLMVKLRRHDHISLLYSDVSGKPFQWNELRRQEAELMQHEFDHLDGILAVDRAETPADIVSRTEYLERKEHYNRDVEYVIMPTV